MASNLIMKILNHIRARANEVPKGEKIKIPKEDYEILIDYLYNLQRDKPDSISFCTNMDGDVLVHGAPVIIDENNHE